MEKKIYVAGPMRGVRHFNFPAFDAASVYLRANGWIVISPADLDREIGFNETAFAADYDWIDLGKIGFSIEDAIDRDVAAIKTCDAIYMLDGWEKSKGATAEKAIAEWRGIEVLYQSTRSAAGSAGRDVLLEAYEITRGDRQAQYGPPDQDFRRGAGMLTALFGEMLKEGQRFEPFHIAQIMILMKMSRQLHQRKRDNWVDTAGYARCGDLCDQVSNEKAK